MSAKNSINAVRRKVMRGLTKYVGRGSEKFEVQGSEPLNIKRILISRPNSRLGNQLMITPLVQEISNTFPDCKVDLFVRGGVSCILFQNYENVDRIIRLPKKPFKELLKYIKVWFSLRKYKYDIVINTDANSSSGRLSTRLSKARFKFFNDYVEELQAAYPDYVHMAKFPVYNFRNYMKRMGMQNVSFEKPIPTLNVELNEQEMDKGRQLLSDLVRDTRKTISIYTFATGDKCYSKEWWHNVYERLKKEYAEEYNIVEVLPVENVSQIDFQAPSYYSQDVREMTAFISNTAVFVSADCGIMHLAAASDTPVIGLFSITNVAKYAPYNKGSVSIDTKTMDVDDIIKAINEALKK